MMIMMMMMLMMMMFFKEKRLNRLSDKKLFSSCMSYIQSKRMGGGENRTASM